MQQVDLTTMMNYAYSAKADLEEIANSLDRDIKLYLHWTAGSYTATYDDYHINITGDGDIYCSTSDFSEVLSHTWRRNSGAIGISICCAADAHPNGFGPNYPPTEAQIDTLEKVVAVLTYALNIPIDINHVLTHAEVADACGNDPGYGEDGVYGPIEGDYEKWDLLSIEPDYPATNVESYDDEHNGGNIIRAKAQEYREQFYGE